MGSGNHSYGNDLRDGGTGTGTFLAPASAMLLSHCRAFAGDLPHAERHPVCTLDELNSSFERGKLVLTGTLKSDIPAFGIAAYNDDMRIKADYDAVGWTCGVDTNGRFKLMVGDLRPGRFQLRLLVCHANGAKSRFPFNYTVNPQRVPDVAVFRYTLQLQQAVAAFAAGDSGRTEELARKLAHDFAEIALVRRKAKHLLELLNPPKPITASRLSETARSVLLSRLAFSSASAGWGRPLRDQVLVEGRGTCFLEVGGEFHVHGLFAHAPSRYRIELDGRWRELRTAFGLQDGHNGSVVFVVHCDGKERFRSSLIKDHMLHARTIDVAGVEKLELVVENGGDDNRNDWGVWIEPNLSR